MRRATSYGIRAGGAHSSGPDASIAVLPALRGFSLSAYALLLTSGDELPAFLAEEHFVDDRMTVPENSVLFGNSAIVLHAPGLCVPFKAASRDQDGGDILGATTTPQATVF